MFLTLIFSLLFATSIQDNIYKEFGKKLDKYETVAFNSNNNATIYYLNLVGTNENVIEACLEIMKDVCILHELDAEKDEWKHTIIKRLNLTKA